jgi:hypothetical protein
MVFLYHFPSLLGCDQGRHYGVFHDFHVSSKFETSLDATFIALNPKKAGAIDLKDFRPISLVSRVCKIITKVLASGLRRVVEKSISKP